MGLHLKPLSRANQRLWEIHEDPQAGNSSPTEFHLQAQPDDHRTYASLSAILKQLDVPLSSFATAKALLEQSMDAAGFGVEVAAKRSDADLLSDSVTLAVTRRISRESVYTAQVIDRAAHLLNSVLAAARLDRVHVRDVDRLDRGTLKVLARAMLLLEPHHEFAWVWHSSTDPTVDDGRYEADPFLASRSALMRQLVGMLQPTLNIAGSRSLCRPRGSTRASVVDLSMALVLQNYDACFLWSEPEFGDEKAHRVVDGLRIRALAAVNVGRLSGALADLATAETRTTAPARLAHLAYLQGLIEAKRHYDLSRSRAHYERGLDALGTGVSAFGDDDLALERAWLLNGIALNEAIMWRRNRADTARLNVAFALLQEAFGLVGQGHGPARIYLRSNLLANSALLLEMRGQHDRAIHLFQDAFENSAQESHAELGRWNTTLGYRLGVLHYRMGDLSTASRLLHAAADDPEASENWPIRERILRAIGVVALDRASNQEARIAFSEGLDVCRQQRSREGVQEHGKGAAAALLALGLPKVAKDLVRELSADEQVDLVPALDLAVVRPSAPAPKLPAYLPEIDLEGLPEIDLNRFLVGAAGPRAEGKEPWTAQR